MTKRLLKELVLASYNKDELDLKKVNEFVSHLSRNELKMYIRALKAYERKITVMVEIPSEKKEQYAQLQSLFPNKKIVYKVDPSLILGVRVISDDIVYEMNLKNSFQRMLQVIAQ
jgi:hypothetical protein